MDLLEIEYLISKTDCLFKMQHISLYLQKYEMLIECFYAIASYIIKFAFFNNNKTALKSTLNCFLFMICFQYKKQQQQHP